MHRVVATSAAYCAGLDTRSGGAVLPSLCRLFTLLNAATRRLLDDLRPQKLAALVGVDIDFVCVVDNECTNYELVRA